MSVQRSEDNDYLFHRLFTPIRLFLRAIGRGGRPSNAIEDPLSIVSWKAQSLLPVTTVRGSRENQGSETSTSLGNMKRWLRSLSALNLLALERLN